MFLFDPGYAIFLFGTHFVFFKFSVTLKEQNVKTEVSGSLLLFFFNFTNKTHVLFRSALRFYISFFFVYFASGRTANQRPPRGDGVLPCGKVSTRGVIIFVPRLLELWVYVSISNPGMGPYSAGWRCLHESQAINDQAPRTPVYQRSAIGVGGRGFHTMRGGIDPGKVVFSPN